MMAYAFASEDLLKEITYEFFEEGWMSSLEVSLAVTGNETKMMMNYSQTRMLMNAFFCGTKYSCSLTARLERMTLQVCMHSLHKNTAIFIQLLSLCS